MAGAMVYGVLGEFPELNLNKFPKQLKKRIDKNRVSIYRRIVKKLAAWGLWGYLLEENAAPELAPA
jgi:hypothetical protein